MSRPDDPLVAAATGPELPPGFEQVGDLVLPVGSVQREQVHWAPAKVRLLERLIRWANKIEHLTVVLACTDPKCREMPVLQRLELPNGGVALFCRHKVRFIRDPKKDKQRRQRTFHVPSNQPTVYRNRKGIRIRAASVD